MKLIIYPPEGEKFSICEKCKNYCIKNPDEICLWCKLQDLDDKIEKD